MKKSILLPIITFAAPLCIFAQEVNQQLRQPKNTFYMSPFSLFISTLKVAYERNVGDKGNSVALYGSLILKKDNNEEKFGGVAELHYRMSLTSGDQGRMHFNFYWSPIAKYTYLDAKYRYSYWNNFYEPDYGSRTTIVRSGGIAFVMGVNTTFVQRFVCNFYLGGGAQYADNQGDDSRYDSIFLPGYTGVMPAAGIEIGVKF